MACQTEGPDTCRSGSKCGSGTGGIPGTGGSKDGSGGSKDGSGGAGESGGGPASGGEKNGSGGGPGSIAECQNSKPAVQDHDTGTYLCDGGYHHRAEAKECPSKLPREGQVNWPEETGAAGGPSYTTSTDECERDSDCSTNDYCTLTTTNDSTCGDNERVPFVPDYARVCQPGCRTDDDCGENELCLCGSMIGVCRPMAAEDGCREDADCGPDSFCLDNAHTDEWGNHSVFSCSRPEDDCSECLSVYGKFCAVGPEGKVCEDSPVCGRPFLVEYSERLASIELRDGWLGHDWEEKLELSSELRQRLAEHWTRIGLMEHASIAAFARFTLDLLSIGAPADLIEASNQALVDETRHARIAFGLASSFAGHSLGPGRLSMEGALQATGQLEDLLRTTFREGCVGETRAALEVARAASSCADPDLRRTLDGIAEDEGRHAELAWRVVRYLVAEHPALRHVLVSEVELVRAESLGAGEFALVEGAGPLDREARREAEQVGLLGGEAIDLVHREALGRVILPCAEALLGTFAPPRELGDLSVS